MKRLEFIHTSTIESNDTSAL